MKVTPKNKEIKGSQNFEIGHVTSATRTRVRYVVDYFKTLQCMSSGVTIGLSRTVSEINSDFCRKSHENRQFFLRTVYLTPPLKGFSLELGIDAEVERN